MNRCIIESKINKLKPCSKYSTTMMWKKRLFKISRLLAVETLIDKAKDCILSQNKVLKT